MARAIRKEGNAVPEETLKELGKLIDREETQNKKTEENASRIVELENEIWEIISCQENYALKLATKVSASAGYNFMDCYRLIWQKDEKAYAVTFPNPYYSPANIIIEEQAILK